MSDGSHTSGHQVLVVDHEPQFHRLVEVLLGEGFDVDGADSAAQALTRLHDRPYDVVLVEEGLPEVDGFDLMRKLQRVAPDQAVIMLTGAASVQDAVRAMREGALDYIRKSASAEELRSSVERAAMHYSLTREVRRLRSEVDAARGLSGMVGDSDSMRELLAMAERVSHSDATVLVIGESGTGKELLARSLHRLGPRSDRPFVAFDCSALAPTLLEAELFGHEKGAFTGAGKARRGLFREAHTGTIFLDEIGDIASPVQNKLLRVLQEREIKPVGGDDFIKIDVRVIAATNKDLKAMVARGEFREDLYWRLAVVPIEVPPLRERKDDIPLLAAHILDRKRGAAKTFAGDESRYPTAISPAGIARLCGYHWPGNIRELENVLSRAAILCDGDVIDAHDLELVGLSDKPAESSDPVPVEITPGRPLKQLVDDAVRAVERQAITDALRKADGSPTKAARLLGISRASMYNKLKAYGLGRAR
ncbi:MAG: sigma-54 dependent transcriptional regulator [Deltaproteobacteria bacterium]|nr:sigma-54 dependent transcriptional regulator [Deltaproteobacteria bacterium]